MKKKTLRSILCCLLLLSFVLNACGSSDKPETKTDGGKKTKVSLLVTGSFGDKAFNDSALAGMKKLEADFADQVEVNLVEMGSDKTKFEGSLLDVSESDSDIIITGLWDMKEITEKVAQEFPDKRYILFDTAVDYTLGDLSNVYSMSYKQNEAAFLAGVLAGKMTASNMELANSEKVVGFIGAKDTAAVINDSAVGYIEGVQQANSEAKVQVSYIGSYVDSAKAKELALTQYASGADVIFVAAGPASVGVIEAATESNKYVIGVDSDQAAAYAGKEEENHIISSAIKDVGASIYEAVSKSLKGELNYGTHEVLGLDAGVVGLADNTMYQTAVPEAIQKDVNAAKEEVLSGKIRVSTAFGMEEAQLRELINQAQK